MALRPYTKKCHDVESAGFARWAFLQVKDLERLIKEIESDSPSTESIIKGPR